MKKLFLFFFAFIISTAYSQDSQWTYLFDGKTLDGWHKYNSDKMSDAWYVDNGELVLKSKNDNLSYGNDIVTDKSFTNFELSIEWKIPKGGNSGIFFKVVEIPEVDAAWKTGPEIQVLDNDNFCCPNTLYHQAPALYDMKPIGKIKFNPHGEWNHLLLKVDHDNNEGSITFNGEFVYSFPLYGPEWDKMVSRSKFSNDEYFKGLVPDHPYFTYAPFFGKFKTGKIGLQDHGWDVRYRNIKIREF
jgi:hypothetical protein